MISSWLKGCKDKYNIQVKFIHCDNARENKKLGEKFHTDELGIIFEYTATETLNRMHLWKVPFQH